MPQTRKDTDSLRTLEIPADGLYGAFAIRGQENFDISFRKRRDTPEPLNALGHIKQAAAAANRDLGALDADIVDANTRASIEIRNGRHAEQVMVDLLEGSVGIWINMNVNEVIANRALNILGQNPGTNSRVHPNVHVNARQSTNEVLLAAVKLAVHDNAEAPVDALGQLAARLEERAKAFEDVLRVGRTCMLPAQPTCHRQAFGGYAPSIRRPEQKLSEARDGMRVLPLGGAAIGTGLGSAPDCRAAVYRKRGRSVAGITTGPTGDQSRRAGNCFPSVSTPSSPWRSRRASSSTNASPESKWKRSGPSKICCNRQAINGTRVETWIRRGVRTRAGIGERTP